MVEQRPNPRRHDLDALRAFAMLLGIALHAGLSFTPFPWPVQDTQQNSAFYLFFAAIHGFRMPLFFLLSGFFTAMLWRRRGLGATLSQRAKRILLPCLLSMVTIVPLLMMSFGWAIAHTASLNQLATPTAEPATLAEAARAGDLDAVKRLIDEEADPNAADPTTSVRPLGAAALRADAEIVGALLDAGADPNAPNGDNYTPLHDAAFVGADEVVALLLERGADPHATSDRGEKPLRSTQVDWGTTTFVANILRLELREQEIVEAGRERAAELLEEAMGGADESADEPSTEPASLREAYAAWLKSDALSVPIAFTEDPNDRFHFVTAPVLFHLWFLWFLCWLVALFAVYAAIGGSGLPRGLVASPARWLLVVPATLVPQWLMHALEPGGFGPDTSVGLLPAPHVLAYYAVFFFYGAAYYDADDREGRADRFWWAELLFALVLFVPALMLAREGSRPAADLLEVAFTWAMCFGMMGAFRKLLPGENRTIRYVSDSSYWLYLAHLPLVIVAQALVVPWQAPALVKFTVVCVVVTAILLVSYQLLVRHTPIGWLLNGRRKRGAEPPLVVDSSGESPPAVAGG